MFCKFCGEERKDELTLNSHMSSCEENPEVKERIQVNGERIAMKNAFEKMRREATNIHDLLDSYVKYFAKQDIIITFESYPDRWDDCVSNSHNAPNGYSENWCGRDKDTPIGYPGWRGTWKGTIKSKNREDDMSNLFPGYFKTGTGSGGQNFRIEGVIFLYDFPQMHEEWKTNKGEVKQMANTFNSEIQHLNAEFNKKLNIHINKNNTILDIENTISDINTLINKIRESRDVIKSQLSKEFHEKNIFNIPNIDSAFINYEKLSKIGVSIQNSLSVEDEDIQFHVKKINVLHNMIYEYYNRHPEIFL